VKQGDIEKLREIFKDVQMFSDTLKRNC